MICVDCKKFLKNKKSGVVVEEMLPHGETWLPYQLWVADLYECPECKRQVVSGFASRPLAEHYQEHYAATREKHPPFMQVPDCGPRHAGPMPVGKGKIG